MVITIAHYGSKTSFLEQSSQNGRLRAAVWLLFMLTTLCLLFTQSSATTTAPLSVFSFHSLLCDPATFRLMEPSDFFAFVIPFIDEAGATQVRARLSDRV